MTHWSTLTEEERFLLLRRHKGLLQRVAERCRVHPSLVSRVFHGKVRSARVERELRKALPKLGIHPAVPGRQRSRAIRFTRPADRSREFQWLTDHRRGFAGKWVALDGYRLIASSDHAKDVFAAARRSRRSPLIHYIEPLDAPLFGGW